ncbi:MAG TPA: lipid A export permease/ATP-binding protein MsbA [Sutterella sp.]|nr:lipid A export permease/ATP-binding protein MsbA [Sutterella sp.]
MTDTPKAETPKSQAPEKSFKRLIKLFGSYKGTIAAAVVAMIVTAGAASVIAIFVGKLTDAGFYEKDPNVIYWAPAALVAIAFLHGASTFASSYLLQSVSQSVIAVLRAKMFDNIIRWPAASHQKFPSGIVVSKFINEASNALGTAAEILTSIVRDSLQVLGLIIVLFFQNWQLTLVSLVIAPLITLILRWVTRRMREYAKKYQLTLGQLSGVIQEAIDARYVIKVCDGYAREEALFKSVNAQIRKFALRMQLVSSAGTPMTRFVAVGAVSVVIVVALTQAHQGAITMGEFVTFLTALLMLLAPIRHLASLNGSIARLTAACDSIYSIIDELPEADTGKTELPRLTGGVRFDGVSLRYEGAKNNALTDFTLDVKPGQTIAFVGDSGAGKSTIINLIPRFWAPSTGEIYFDGVPQSAVTLKSLRKNLALVSQDVVLFDDTIAANIAFGQEHATREAIEAAARAAYLMPFIESLPKGLDTPVGEAGSRLSGGQKQRISIARALLKNAPILLLDEATSALDTQSEKYIQDSLKELMRGRTTFVVAHRLSTIEGADLIVVIKDGRIVEMGCHTELLEKKGQYAHLYSLQFSKRPA